MKVSVIDLGVNNIRSVLGALEHVGLDSRVAVKPGEVEGVALIPGIGHFGFVAGAMRERGWMEALASHGREGRPVLGICLGMQLLFEGSEEAPGESGLGLLPGRVGDLAALVAPASRLPVTGWRRLEGTEAAVDGRAMYFNHGFGVAGGHPQCMASYSYEGARIAAIVGRGRVMGLQFHPEKSGLAGLHLLRWCVETISRESI